MELMFLRKKWRALRHNIIRINVRLSLGLTDIDWRVLAMTNSKSKFIWAADGSSLFPSDVTRCFFLPYSHRSSAMKAPWEYNIHSPLGIGIDSKFYSTFSLVIESKVHVHPRCRNNSSGVFWHFVREKLMRISLLQPGPLQISSYFYHYLSVVCPTTSQSLRRANAPISRHDYDISASLWLHAFHQPLNMANPNCYQKINWLDLNAGTSLTFSVWVEHLSKLYIRQVKSLLNMMYLSIYICFCFSNDIYGHNSNSIVLQLVEHWGGKSDNFVHNQYPQKFVFHRVLDKMLLVIIHFKYSL